MSRAIRVALLAVFALVASCGPSHVERARPAMRAASDYFAATVGDRVRMRIEPGGHDPTRFEHSGVSGRDAGGRVVVSGTDRVAIAFHRIERDAVWIVSPEGVSLVPTVVGPIRTGTVTNYTVDQGTSPGACSLTISRTDVPITVAGIRLEGCIEQSRHCALAAGGGLPTATSITEDETLCPRVGLVKRRFRATPPLPFDGVSSDERSELTGFRIAGAPTPPAAAALADRLILLPSDVAAACGGIAGAAELRAHATTASGRPLPELVVPPDARADDVLLAFELAGSRLVVEARPGTDSSLDAYRSAALTDRSVPARVAFATPHAIVRITGVDRCPDASAFEPLIESLLR